MLGEGAVPRGRRAAPEADDAGSRRARRPRTGGRCSPEGWREDDPTFWILARASGLTAYVLLTLSVLAGLVVKSRPFGRALKAAAVDRHAPLPLAARARRARAARARARARLDRAHRAGRAARPRPRPYRPLATGLGVLAAELAVLIVRLVPAPQADRHARTGGACTGRPTASSLLATAHGLAAGTDTRAALGPRPLPRRVGAVAFATAWRALAAPPDPRPERST